MRRWCSGHSVFARVIQRLGFWTQKIQANVDYCYVRRRAECTPLGPGLEYRSPRSDSSPAAKRRADALHVELVLTKASEPCTRAVLLSLSVYLSICRRDSHGLRPVPLFVLDLDQWLGARTCVSSCWAYCFAVGVHYRVPSVEKHEAKLM